jgi:hypothetical protein
VAFYLNFNKYCLDGLYICSHALPSKYLKGIFYIKYLPTGFDLRQVNLPQPSYYSLLWNLKYNKMKIKARNKWNKASERENGGYLRLNEQGRVQRLRVLS